MQAEQALNKKQADLFNPIYEKVGAAIEEVRKEGGFTMVLNSQGTQGVNIVLAADEELNVTEQVLQSWVFQCRKFRLKEMLLITATDRTQ